MAITYIIYTKEQRSNCDVSGYSIYINGSYTCMFESMPRAKDEAYRYSPCNDVEIYPVLKRRY